MLLDKVGDLNFISEADYEEKPFPKVVLQAPCGLPVSLLLKHTSQIHKTAFKPGGGEAHL